MDYMISPTTGTIFFFWGKKYKKNVIDMKNHILANKIYFKIQNVY